MKRKAFEDESHQFRSPKAIKDVLWWLTKPEKRCNNALAFKIMVWSSLSTWVISVKGIVS